MNLSQFLSILRARWWVAALIFLLTVGAAIGISLVLPKQYTATATLVVDQTRPDPVAAARYSGNPSPAFMATQVDVLKSDRVAQHVVRKLGLAHEPEAREEWLKATEGAGSLEAWLVEALQLPLDVKPSRESNVISVSFKSPDPAKAAMVANAFVQAYMDVSLELRVDPAKQYSAFFDTRGKELRANVERAQAKLSAYQREKGVIIASDGQLDVETARLQRAVVAARRDAGGRRRIEQPSGAGPGRRRQTAGGGQQPRAVEPARRHPRARRRAFRNSLRAWADNHPQVIEAKRTSHRCAPGWTPKPGA